MRTFTCMVVDDEILMLQRLQLIFDSISRSYGQFRLGGAANSSMDALKLAEEVRPDIVITDIVMPGMNGLQLIGELKKAFPRAVFIVLSAYPDFHYAQRALELNVLQYLVKVPLSEPDLTAALLRAQNILEEQEAEQSRQQQMGSTIRGNIHRLRQQIVAEFLRGEIGPSVMESRCRELMIPFEPHRYSCMLVSIGQIGRQGGTRDRKLYKYGMINIIEELITQTYRGFACELEPDLLIGFVSWRNLNSGLQLEQAAFDLGQSIHANIKKYMKISVTAAFSPLVHGWESAQRAYENVQLALSHAFYLGAGRVVTPGRMPRYDEARLPELTSAFHQLAALIAAGQDDVQRVRPMVHIKEIVQTGSIHPQRLMDAVDAFIKHLETKAYGSIACELPKSPHFDTCERLIVWLEEELIPWFEQMSLTDNRLEIRKAKQYIEQNLPERLSLNLVAEHVSLNAAYFSTLFKKETGESLTDYINRSRIDRAKELLKSGDCGNAELAEAVGITDERYFCTLFRKYTGSSPKKFSSVLKEKRRKQ